MKIFHFWIVALLAWTSMTHAQTNDTVEIKKTIDKIFTGMQNTDSSLVRQAFHPQALLLSVIQTKTGEAKYMNETPASFIKAVGTPHIEVWREVLHSYEIRIDGIMASAWTPYTFFLSDTFSHCGVNLFTLMKTAEGWKIISIADTRRKEGCK